MADKKPCDDLARALADDEPTDLAVVVGRGDKDVCAVTAQALGVGDVTVTACGGAACFVQARGAHRLVGQRVASGLQVRAAHWVVIGRVDGVTLDVALWRDLFRDCDGAEARAPLVVACVCRCHACFAFVDKRMASRVLMTAFGLTPATSTRLPSRVAVGNVAYSVAHTWSPAPHRQPDDSVVYPPAAEPVRRAVVVHDAENCAIGPASDGVALHRNVVAQVRACVGNGADDAMRVEWSVVLRSPGANDAAFRPSRRAIEDLRDLA